MASIINLANRSDLQTIICSGNIQVVGCDSGSGGDASVGDCSVTVDGGGDVSDGAGVYNMVDGDVNVDGSEGVIADGVGSMIDGDSGGVYEGVVDVGDMIDGDGGNIWEGVGDDVGDTIDGDGGDIWEGVGVGDVVGDTIDGDGGDIFVDVGIPSKGGRTGYHLFYRECARNMALTMKIWGNLAK